MPPLLAQLQVQQVDALAKALEQREHATVTAVLMFALAAVFSQLSLVQWRRARRAERQADALLLRFDAAAEGHAKTKDALYRRLIEKGEEVEALAQILTPFVGPLEELARWGKRVGWRPPAPRPVARPVERKAEEPEGAERKKAEGE